MTRNFKRRIEILETSMQTNPASIRKNVWARTLKQLTKEQLMLIYNSWKKPAPEMTDDEVKAFNACIELYELECKRHGFSPRKNLRNRPGVNDSPRHSRN